MATPDAKEGGESRLGGKECLPDDPAALDQFRKILGERLRVHGDLPARDQAMLAGVVSSVGRVGLSRTTEADAYGDMSMLADLLVTAFDAGSVEGVLPQGGAAGKPDVKALAAQVAGRLGEQLRPLDERHGGRLERHFERVQAHRSGAPAEGAAEQRFLPDIDAEAAGRVAQSIHAMVITALQQPTLTQGLAAIRDLAGAFSRSDPQGRMVLILGACSPSDESAE